MDRVVLRWLPAAILALLAGAGVAGVQMVDGAPRAMAGEVQPAPLTVPLLSLRRDTAPLVAAVAEHRLSAALDEVIATFPVDTCLTVRVGGYEYAHRADDLQVPASAQKLLVAVAALRALGPDHRFRTVAAVDGDVQDGVLGGDLFVVGGGDPLLATAAYAARYEEQPQIFSDLADLADAVAAAGIGRVDGALVAVEGRYDTVRAHPSWPGRYVVQGQIGPLSALLVHDGFASWPSRGLLPVQPAADPAIDAVSILRDLLAERGVVVSGGVRSGTLPDTAVEVAAHESPPLREVVAELLSQSDNVTAEMLLRELGARLAADGSFAGGAAAMRATLADAGVDTTNLVAVDGSGLSGEDRVSCRTLADALDVADTRDTIVQGLAVAGTSGTLRDRFVGTPLVGRLRAKTGTLRGVASLVGVVGREGSEPVRFALVANIDAGRLGDRIFSVQEALGRLLLDPPDPPDVSSVVPRATDAEAGS